MMRSSVVIPVGSAFRRTEPGRMKGSCGMVIILDRIISRGIVLRSRSSILIVPEELSRMRRRTERRELFPLQKSLDEYHAKNGVHLPACAATYADFLAMFDAKRNVFQRW